MGAGGLLQGVSQVTGQRQAAPSWAGPEWGVDRAAGAPSWAVLSACGSTASLCWDRAGPQPLGIPLPQLCRLACSWYSPGCRHSWAGAPRAQTRRGPQRPARRPPRAPLQDVGDGPAQTPGALQSGPLTIHLTCPSGGLQCLLSHPRSWLALRGTVTIFRSLSPGHRGDSKRAHRGMWLLHSQERGPGSLAAEGLASSPEP